MNFDWKKTVGAVAPILGSALGGPFGGMAGAAIAAALGVDNDEAAISAAVHGATPEQMIAIKNADLEFKSKMAEMGFKSAADLERIASDDRANARAREMTLNDWTPKALCLAIVVGFFGVIALLAFKELPQSARDSLFVLVGTLGTAFVSVVQYYFGSSAGSAAKSNTIHRLKA
ncbi:hypothetical protein [Deefgea piscis]|uniref:hypothetical protein n=1 Tax=Deefgea piscis TaxID=2739061 RepID=UPI001C7FAB21|nr:hypothetical protein [Deefgea piscis]QZA80844.1 hypothetical protein K4H25_15340 [Deefgea piscis]